MKNKIRLTDLSRFELTNDEMSHQKGGAEGPICAHACSCNATCPENDNVTKENSINNQKALNRDNTINSQAGDVLLVLLTVGLAL